MDLETENRIAAILLKEAAELRRQSEKEGVLAYLRQPKARGRPNSRFLTATVLGVQQANRAVEVNEMWRVRQKEQELDDRLKKKQKDESGSFRNHRDSATSSGSTSKTNAISNKHTNSSYSSSKRVTESCYPREDEGLRDEEVEEFLHSRVKRGRGAVGSRMDETGPYLPSDPDSKEQLSSSHDMRGHRVVIGPEKPSSLKSYESSSEEEIHENRRKKAKKGHSGGSSKEHSWKHKHRSKEKSRDKKRRDLKTISESRDKKKERSKS